MYFYKSQDSSCVSIACIRYGFEYPGSSSILSELFSNLEHWFSARNLKYILDFWYNVIMKYGLGIKIFISFVVGGIAVLYKIKADPKQNMSEISTVVKVPHAYLFDFVTKPSNVPTVSFIHN